MMSSVAGTVFHLRSGWTSTQSPTAQTNKQKHFKPIVVSRITVGYKMPCYKVIDGMKEEMDQDIFDQMVEALHQSDDSHNPPTQETHTRWTPDGSYDKKPLDQDYFSK